MVASIRRFHMNAVLRDCGREFIVASERAQINEIGTPPVIGHGGESARRASARSSRCNGRRKARTFSCRPAVRPSTAPSSAFSKNGTRDWQPMTPVSEQRPQPPEEHPTVFHALLQNRRKTYCRRPQPFFSEPALAAASKSRRNFASSAGSMSEMAQYSVPPSRQTSTE